MRISWFLAGCAALAATSALAQDYPDTAPPPPPPAAFGAPYGSDVAYQPGTEEIDVYAPRHARSSVTGAPIEDVALSRAVRFDDLDLRNDGDVRILHARIRSTARALCRDLDTRYPIGAEGSPPCYENAVQTAMAQADDAVDAARRY